MNKRVTIIAKVENDILIKINSLFLNNNLKICKVPYYIDDKNRNKLDTLPYHTTFYATDIKNIDIINNVANNLTIQKFTLITECLKIKKLKNSHCLIIKIKPSNNAQQIKNAYYDILKDEKFNNSFDFHLTLHISKDFNEIEKAYEIAKSIYQNFEINVNAIDFFEIYPAVHLKSQTLN